MSASSGKRALIPKKGSGLQLRDGIFCNRLGCHGRLNHSKAPISGQTSIRVHSSSGKAIVGSSNRPSSTKITLRKATSEGNPSSSLVAEAEFQSQSNNNPSRKIRMGEVVGSSNATSSGLTSKSLHSSSRKAIVGSSTQTSSTKITLRKATSKGSPSSSHVEPAMSELSSAETVQAGFQSQSNNNPSKKIRMGEVVGRSSATSSSRPLKVSKQRSGQRNQETLLGLSISLTSKSSSSCREASDNNTRIDSSRSVSTSYTNLNRNRDVAQKQKLSAIETKIPLRGKQISTPKTVGGLGSVTVPSNGISISDSRHRPWSRSNNNNRPSNLNRNRDVAQKQNLSAIETKIPLRGKQISTPKTVGGLGSVTVPSNGISISDSRHRPWSRSNSNNRPNTIPSRTPVPRPSSSTSRPLLRGSSSRTVRSPSPIGREQLLGTDVQFSQGGIGDYDQFRDMRLDIDNMSYEDLLALEERIGNVSIGIEENNMWKYLSRRNYDHTSSSLENHTDIQCSICQVFELLVGWLAGRIREWR